MSQDILVNTLPTEGANYLSLEEPKKMMRENWRKKKELEEQRKLGNAPAEVVEEGKDINPHIPQYISSVPWYIDPSRRPTLKHQRRQPEKQKQYSSSGDWYKRGLQEHSVATRYRKGACENCGALTHKRKDCMERPRKAGAKYTGMNIAPDEHVQPQLMFAYDGKRDRWNGYNPEEHMKTVKKYSKVDLAKRTLKAQKLQEELASEKLEQVNSPKHQGRSHEFLPGYNLRLGTPRAALSTAFPEDKSSIATTGPSEEDQTLLQDHHFNRTTSITSRGLQVPFNWTATTTLTNGVPALTWDLPLVCFQTSTRAGYNSCNAAPISSPNSCFPQGLLPVNRLPLAMIAQGVNFPPSLQTPPAFPYIFLCSSGLSVLT
uniref:Pre-mRNA-splicing factor SLU7 n=1 Tax=Ficedula albicollis TaxID=59894 RepID=A0A803VIL2_FICAL